MADAQRRLAENKLKPGEDVKIVDDRVQVSGPVAVMSINGLIAKVIFDRNPDREFYIEESFALDWMYPYLEPHGLIMKLNRQPLAQLPGDSSPGIMITGASWSPACWATGWTRRRRCARSRSLLTGFMCTRT